MKKILPVLLSFFSTASAQQLAIGDQMPDMTLGHTLNGDVIKTSSFAGKLLVIEFWATWCSPCVDALSDLEKSKRKLGRNFEVLAVSQESEDRLKKFMSVRPTTLTVGRDVDGNLRKYFPHRTIPHSVLIGPDGKIYAITEASRLTTRVLRSALRRQPVKLPLKKDFVDFNIDTYFKTDSTKSRNFSMLPAVEGVGGRSQTYSDGPFKGRRITIVNATMDKLFEIAYNKSHAATINDYDSRKLSWDEQEKFCVDAWIESADQSQLMNYIREQLNRHFVDVQATIEKKNRKVLVLKSDNAGKLLKPSLDKRGFYNAGKDHFDGFGITLDQLAEYVEYFQICKGMTLNETRIEGRYDLKFQFQPEKKDAFKDALAVWGLYLIEGDRIVDILMIRKR